MTKKFIVEIELENAAFDTDPEREMSYMLMKLADDIGLLGWHDGFKVKDINGNIVGEVRVEDG